MTREPQVGDFETLGRCSDLSPLDFFLWGYIKNIVYAEKMRNIQHLQERITSATETVTRDKIQKTWQEIEFRLDVSRATKRCTF